MRTKVLECIQRVEFAGEDQREGELISPIRVIGRKVLF